MAGRDPRFGGERLRAIAAPAGVFLWALSFGTGVFAGGFDEKALLPARIEAAAGLPPARKRRAAA